MSAQAGVYLFDGRPADPGLLARMTDAINECGPDGGMQYLSGSVGMVYRALHTTEESRHEVQPHISRKGAVVMWDGRLDNRDELISQLDDDLKSERTDVAIVATALDRWGTRCLSKLAGDWALALWDPRERALVLARDYVGIRHLYYHPRSECVMWCSNLASLVLLTGSQFTLNEEYIAGYLAMYPAANLTPYREISAVPPGSFVCVRDGNPTVQSYRACQPGRMIRYKTDAEYEEHFREVFGQAVGRRLRSDSPILADLSGGLDSSSIVCLADEIVAKKRFPSPRVDTISHFDAEERNGDDFPYVRIVEERRGKTGYHIDAGKHRPSFTNETRNYMAVPGGLGDRQSLEDERLRFMQAGGYRTLLSGIGGDEFLGGIPDPRPQLGDLIVQFRFRQLAKQLIAWSLVKRRPLIQLLLGSLSQLLPPNLRVLLEKKSEVEDYIGSDFARRQRFAKLKLGPLKDFGFLLPSRRDLARTLVVLSWQMSQTQPTAGACVERRYPYLDQNFVEFITSIPATQLLRPGDRRSLMRRALRDVLPKEILLRTSKNIWAGSYMISFRDHSEQIENLFKSPLTAQFGFVDGDRFLRVLMSAKNGNAPNITHILRLISLELWLRQVMSRKLIQLNTEISPAPGPRRVGSPVFRAGQDRRLTPVRVEGKVKEASLQELRGKTGSRL